MNSIESIRTSTISDLEQLSELFNLYRIFYGKDDDIATATVFINERIKQEDSVIIVAETIDGQLVGFTQLYPIFSSVSAKKAWVLNDLFILENFRKQCVATELILKSIELGKNSNAAWISLQTASDNYNAQALYEKIGFTKDNHYLDYVFNL